MKISVTIPCLNEKPYIEECIHAIYANKVNEGIELFVFVVDGMSTDGTRDVVKALKSQYPTLTLVDNSIRLTPFAFNLGIKSMEADYYQVVGARHILSDNYLQTSLDILEKDKNIWCVGGRIVNSYINHTGEIIANAMSTAFGMGIGNFRTLEKSGFTDTVTSPMYPAWVFDKIGYFDEVLIRNQDDDFNFRVTKNGGKIFYEHGISLKYYVRGNFQNLSKQFFQYGYWKVYVNKKHHTVTTLRQLVPPLFVIYLALLAVTLVIGGWFFAVGSGLFIIYLLLNLFFSLQITISTNDVFKTMRAYTTMHIAYGAGYLKGIWHFIIQKRTPSEREKSLSR